MFLSELNYSRSLFAIVMSMPLPTEFFIENAFTVLAVRHELFLDGRDERKTIGLFPFPASGLTESSDDAIAIDVCVRLKVLELVVYVNLLAVDNYLFHITHQLKRQTIPSRGAHTGY